MRWRSSGWAYATLLAGQTAAAAALFVIVFPLFRQIVTHLGERQELSLSQQALIMTIAAVLHVLYWARLKWVAVVAPFHNVFAAHLCSFASRVSFFFGGALFSALFFQAPSGDRRPIARWPDLDQNGVRAGGAVRAVLLFAGTRPPRQGVGGPGVRNQTTGPLKGHSFYC